MKIFFAMASLLITAASAAGGHRTSLEDIEKDYNSNDKSSSYASSTKVTAAALPSPTKFGFVPYRTASSYAATKPKYQYSQINYQVKKSPYKSVKQQYLQPAYSQQYTQPTNSYSQATYGASQQYAQPAYSQQYAYPAQQYSPEKSVSAYTQQHFGSRNHQPDYTYIQPSEQQYDNVQYVSDNGIGQSDAGQPQYYYVQQYQAPSTAVESVVDPKGYQYVYLPSYNAIQTDQKYYSEGAENGQLPPTTTTVSKYTKALPGKSSLSYVSTSPKVQYQQPQQEIAIKREPTSLLDSYVPSIVQLQYLRNGKNSFSKY